MSEPAHPPEPRAPRERVRRALPWLLLPVVVASALSVVVQFRLIHSFRPQTPRGLATGAFLRDAAPIVSVVVLALVLACAAWAWRGARLRRRLALVLLALAAAAVVPASRVDVFQKMFAPVADPAFVSAAEAGFLLDSDMVLAVGSGGDAVAYPVRLLAYHHLVHDAVGGRALVATY